MANQLSDLDRTKRAVAALVTCVVTTLNETEPSFQERFLANLDKAYCKFQDDTGDDVIQELELLSWTRRVTRSPGGVPSGLQEKAPLRTGLEVMGVVQITTIAACQIGAAVL